jgi:hypothetical protein
MPGVTLELRDVAPSLWIWRMEHPDHEPGHGWDSLVTSSCVEPGGEVAVLNGLAPEGELRIWTTLEHERWTVPALRALLEPWPG